VASDAGISWWAIIRNVFSLGFFRAAAVLFAISLSVGVILWLIEHRHNEHFGPHRISLADINRLTTAPDIAARPFMSSARSKTLPSVMAFSSASFRVIWRWVRSFSSDKAPP
jgi:hypothetical protein